jgi:hypothetical protein
VKDRYRGEVALIERLEELVNGNAALVRRGRYVSLAFLWGIGDDDYIVEIARGRVVSVDKRTLATNSGHFTVRAPAEVWAEFWKPLPKRNHHDLFSMLSVGLAEIDGDVAPLMQNLQYFKDLLAVPRARQ